MTPLEMDLATEVEVLKRSLYYELEPAVTLPPSGFFIEALEELHAPTGGMTTAVPDIEAGTSESLAASSWMTSRAYLPSHTGPDWQALRPENRALLAFLDRLMRERDDKGAHWWDAFERDLLEHRMRLREKPDA